MDDKPRLVGINHVALEVGSVREALGFYGQIFEFELRARSDKMAFIDMGDQFIALSEGRKQSPDEHRHFGLVVDDKELVREKLEEARVEIIPTKGLNFLDPWGNRVQVVQYSEVQFTKASHVLLGMRMGKLKKSPKTMKELEEKGITAGLE